MSESGTGNRPDVAALVLTYQSPVGLDRCLRAIEAQTIRPGRILVVDNGPSDESRRVLNEHPSVDVLDLEQNLGPAGGYAAGLRRLANEENRWLWVMDDDCEPGPTLLEQLLESADRDTAEVQALRFPAACDAETGEAVAGLGWWCVLIPADAVARCGVPREDLFFWAEDGEYFFRLRTAGHALEHEEDAIVRVVRARNDSTRPAWKYYYITRNGVYTRLAVFRMRSDPSVTTKQRYGQLAKAVRTVVLMTGRVVRRERERRGSKLRAVARGASDGVLGRLGKTWEPECADRPTYET